MIQRIFGKLQAAFNGIGVVLKTDSSFQWQFVSGLLAIGGVSYVSWPLTSNEGLFLALGWTLLLITEIQNSAIEKALDRIHPSVHTSIGVSKDMTAGAVVFAGLFFLLVSIAIVFSHLFG